jgi:dipeptidyl aminopeptidase/acylaminoacyl peptidase
MAATNNSSAATAYVYDLRRQAATRAPVEMEGAFAWTRGADTILNVNATGDVLATPLDGAGATTKLFRFLDWSADGDPMSAWGPWLAFAGTPRGDSAGTRRIGIVHRDSAGRIRPLLPSRFTQAAPSISPDGRWIAYMSNENGRFDIFVSAFPVANSRVQISTNGGQYPTWSSDSRAVYFQRVNQIIVVSVEPASGAQLGLPRPTTERVLYQRDPWGAFDLSIDGKTLVFTDRVREGEPRSLLVNLNAIVRH